MDDKKCFKCELIFPLHFFYKHVGMKDGHLNKCKICTRKDENKRRRDNADKWRIHDKNRYKNNIERRLFTSEATKRHREKYPEKYKARTAVSNAMRDGKLIKKPCYLCGNEKSQAHHDDYSKPLEVLWVCSLCHIKVERKNCLT